jgi:hypothetical protein
MSIRQGVSSLFGIQVGQPFLDRFLEPFFSLVKGTMEIEEGANQVKPKMIAVSSIERESLQQKVRKIRHQ